MHSSSGNRSIISKWPYKHQVSVGKKAERKTSVTIYRRKASSGKWSFVVANYTPGGNKPRLDSYSTEPAAIAAAEKVGRKLLKQNANAQLITNRQAKEYLEVTDQLRLFKLPLLHTVAAVVHCLKLVGSLPALRDAAELYHERLVSKKHSHKCPKCGTIWWHTSIPTWTDEQESKEHRCPDCKTEQRGIFKHAGP